MARGEGKTEPFRVLPGIQEVMQRTSSEAEVGGWVLGLPFRGILRSQRRRRLQDDKRNPPAFLRAPGLAEMFPEQPLTLPVLTTNT